MATLFKTRSGFAIQFKLDAKRPVIRLGKLSRGTASKVLAHVDDLLAARAANVSPDPLTLKWLAKVDPAIRARIERAGLAERRSVPAAASPVAIPLDNYFATYLKGRTDIKPFTVRTLTSARNAAAAFFGADRDMRGVTAGDAADFKRKMLETYAAATVASYIKRLRQLWSDAMSRKLLAENPWLAVRAGSFKNKARQQYVPAEWVQRVIEHVENPEWRLIFGLARFAGLRIPSEIDRLTWTDVDLARGLMVIHSPKTEHHEGRDKRTVPIFPKLRPLFEALRRDGQKPADRVFPARRAKSNLSTQGRRYVRACGMTPWPKFWNNLRSSCETDLAQHYPLHVVCAWIGNSANVARDHYLQVTQDHYAEACAAKSAAGLELNSEGVARFLADFRGETCPTGTKQVVKDLRKLQKTAVALQKLQQTHGDRIRRQLYRKLRTEVTAAKRRVRARRGSR